MLFGGIHCHLFAHFPMFSHADVAILSGFYTRHNYSGNNGVPDPTIPVHILVSEMGVYAISADDVESLQKLTSIYLNDSNRDDFDKDLEKRYTKTENRDNISAVDYQKAFLEFLKKYNLNISMYKADDDLTKWTKLALNPDSNTNINNPIITTNCN